MASQLHELFFRKLIAQTRIQIVGNIRWRISQGVGQVNDEPLDLINGVMSSLRAALNFSSLRPAFLPTAELMSIQNGQPMRAAVRTLPS
jgi:hypothetical protein